MKNIIYEKYSKDKFNQDENFKVIMNKVEKMRNKSKVRLSNIAAVVFAIILFGSISPWVYAEIKSGVEFKNFRNREYEMSVIDIKDVTERGLVEKIDMDYVFQNGIGIKIDSLFITDNHLEIKTNFKIPEDKEIDSENFGYRYAIYDENNIIYGIVPRVHANEKDNFGKYEKCLSKELGLKWNDNGLKQLYTFSSAPTIYAENYNIITKIMMDTSKEFPKSKKIFIRISDLGCLAYDENNNLRYDVDLQISNAEWIFELDIPKRFYEDNNTKLKLKDELQNIKINNLYADDIKLRVDIDIDCIYSDEKIKFSAKDLFEMITITDEEGNEYEQIQGSIDNSNIVRDFAINKSMLEKKYFLNIKINNNIYTRELVVDR